jgi:hypothetical protein
MFNKIDPSFSLCIVSKGTKEWNLTCLDYGLFEHKLATPMK